MPELPEVEIYRRYFIKTSLRRKIKSVETDAPRILRETDPEILQERLANKSFKSAGRIGKYLYAKADEKNYLVMHFGMTGSLAYFKSEEEKPPYTRFLITFSNGFHLAFDDPRKFGSIRIVSGPAELSRIKNLGPDALSKKLTVRDFIKILRTRSGNIKGGLMDQRNVAGIGNIYSDEILFHSGINPGRLIKDLDTADLKKIYKNMIRILNRVIAVDADFKSVPGDYLLHKRKAGVKCPKCGGKIGRKKVAGRSSYFCRGHQK